MDLCLLCLLGACQLEIVEHSSPSANLVHNSVLDGSLSLLMFGQLHIASLSADFLPRPWLSVYLTWSMTSYLRILVIEAPFTSHIHGFLSRQPILKKQLEISTVLSSSTSTSRPYCLVYALLCWIFYQADLTRSKNAFYGCLRHSMVLSAVTESQRDSSFGKLSKLRFHSC